MMTHILTRALLAAGLGWSGNATAQATDTLSRIRALNAVTIGHRDVSVPFSFLDEQQRPVGYSLDLCAKIVDAIRTSQNLPNLEVRHRVVTAASRIPLIANGTVDLECGATTNTAERQQQVGFLVTT
jgi:glutamate/aspartate transport system substrate-binding protein